MLDDELKNLRRVVANGGTASEIDDALLPLIARLDPSIIAPILMLLNESGDQDGMWSILHTAESFDGPVYRAGLLTALPVLAQSCRWWATTLMIRVLNSDTDHAELTAQLRDASLPTKKAVAAICEQLSKDARFQAKAAAVLAAAKA
jgi:hypothetical protein